MKEKLSEPFYGLLNKDAFVLAIKVDMPLQSHRGGRDRAANILKILKATIRNTQN